MSDDLYVGIDLGISSCGWAAVTDQSLIALGTRTFDAPETAKERTPTNQLRRIARGMRRVIDRRRKRMNHIRMLLAQHGLLDHTEKSALAAPNDLAWRARAEGLDRLLTDHEMAAALGHMAKHRQFKSNSKRDKGANAPSDSSKMLAAVAKTQDILAKYRTVGEMFWRDSEFKTRKRNRDGEFSRTVLRSDLEAELHKLFASQRRLGNLKATPQLEAEFIHAAFFQRPLADAEDKVGPCPLEPDEKRTAKHAPSFEKFRLLARLNTLRLADAPLGANQIALVLADFGRRQGLTYKHLRGVLKLADGQRFVGISADEESKRDVVARSGKAMPGSAALFKVLGESGWASLCKTPDRLDRIAAILAFRDAPERIRQGLDELHLDPPILNALLDGVESGAFADFKGAGHISAKACRTILPHMAQGLDYAQACAKVGYNHSARQEADMDAIANPVAKKALTEGLKQVKAVFEDLKQKGLCPTHIHVELARDIGKSLEERQKIESGIDKRNAEKDKLRLQFKETVGQECANAEDLLRFELWKEQNGRCLYTDQEISPNQIVSGDNSVQVDHILPWSRSGDDSFINKTLCLSSANQKKRGRTPYEWISADGLDWATFNARVEGCLSMKGRKKRNFLLKDASCMEERFRNRNLTDTRYACRLLLNVLKSRYPHLVVQSRPGPLTDRLRRAWGLQSLKKNPDGTRQEDDRHHALDSVIVALTSQSMLNRLTRLFQSAEQRGLPTNWHGIGHLADLFRATGPVPDEINALQPPWTGFRADVEKLYKTITVSRAERRRARGEGHAATIRQIGHNDDGSQTIYERKSVDALTEKDLDRIKDAQRNHRMVQVLRDWIKAGKPKTHPPLSVQKYDGQTQVPIRKVRLTTTKKVDVKVRDGAADRGEMTRVDVFRKANKKGKAEFYLVPVYPHQIATQATPPNQAVASGKDEAHWPQMDTSFEFLWSLYPLSWIEIEKSDGTFIDGYFRGLDRNTGAITISPHHSKAVLIRSIGVKTLAVFRKYTIDRLGKRFEIVKEIRTWRGGVCI